MSTWTDSMDAEARELARQVDEVLLGRLKGYASIFPTWPGLAARIEPLTRRVRDDGYQALRYLTTAHNELCVALDLLGSASTCGLLKLDYEPPSDQAEKRIDFRLQLRAEPDVTVWIEVKTLAPETHDALAKYREIESKRLFPENVNMVFAGATAGEDFHDSYSARGSMLTYALETEGRIAARGIDPSKEECLLVFCGNGFDWTLDELEDFVAYYNTGSHRDDDGFRKMEAFVVEQKRTVFSRAIGRFGYFERGDLALYPSMQNWRVTPPTGP